VLANVSHKGEAMKTTFYEVVCSSCGGKIRYYHDKFRREHDADGRERYFHLPRCPQQVHEENLYDARSQMACL